MSQDALLQHTGTIYRLSTSQDASGGTVNTYTVRQEDVACMIRPLSSTEVLAFASQQLQVSHAIVTLYTGTAVGDRFTDSEGFSYDIRGIAKSRAMGSVSTFVTLQGWQLL